jgi:hypothetical protein
MTNAQLVLEHYNQNAVNWKNQGVRSITHVAEKIAAIMDLQNIKYKHTTVMGDLTYARQFCPEKLVLPTSAFISPKGPKKSYQYKRRGTPMYQRVADMLANGRTSRDTSISLGISHKQLLAHIHNAIAQGRLKREKTVTVRYYR